MCKNDLPNKKILGQNTSHMSAKFHKQVRKITSQRAKFEHLEDQVLEFFNGDMDKFNHYILIMCKRLVAEPNIPVEELLPQYRYNQLTSLFQADFEAKSDE